MAIRPLERCTRCGRIWQPASSEPSKTCPDCGATGTPVASYYQPKMQAEASPPPPRQRIFPDVTAQGDEERSAGNAVLTPALIAVFALLIICVLLGIGVAGWMQWSMIPPPVAPAAAVALPAPANEAAEEEGFPAPDVEVDPEPLPPPDVERELPPPDVERELGQGKMKTSGWKA
jgi:predicted  nucleic acid-binding Zn-ribbon protein